MVGTEALVILLLCGFILLLIAISSWYRRRKMAEKKDFTSLSRIHETVIDGQRTFRIATVSRQNSGQLALDVYEVRLPRPSDPNGAPIIRLLPPPLPPRTIGRSTEIIIPTSPPPPFSAALNMPVPSSTSSRHDNEHEHAPDSPTLPPPRYDEVIPVSTISGCKIPQDNTITTTTTNSCIVTVDPTTSTIIST